MDMDTFFVSVERLLNNRLKGKPVIIGGTTGRGVVAGCSYEARQYGVSSVMTMKMALKLCCDAVVMRGDMEQYSKFSRMVTGLIGVRLSHLVNGVQQPDLFEDTPEMVNFYRALDRIRHRFGNNAVQRAVAFATDNPKKVMSKTEKPVWRVCPQGDR